MQNDHKYLLICLIVVIMLFTGCVSSNPKPFREEAANLMFTETGIFVITPKHKTLSKQHDFKPGQFAKIIRTETGYEIVPGKME